MENCSTVVVAQALAQPAFTWAYVAWAFFLLGSAAGLWRSWQLARGTTLRAAWNWAAAALALTAICEALALAYPSAANAPSLAPWRFTALVALVCPGVAVLGAKRPQHGAWQFVVLSLAAILALPAAERLLLPRAGEFSVAVTRAWFVAAVALAGVLNYLPTRYFAAALLVGAAQSVFLAPQLGLLAISPAPAWGLLLLGMAGFAVYMAKFPQAQGGPAGAWFEFCQRFGFLWSARLLERFNATAADQHWPLELAAGGGCLARDEGERGGKEANFPNAARDCLYNLLRRFVSSDWLAAFSPAAPAESPSPAASAAPPAPLCQQSAR